MVPKNCGNILVEIDCGSDWLNVRTAQTEENKSKEFVRIEYRDWQMSFGEPELKESDGEHK